MGSLRNTFMATACVAAISLGATTAQAADLETPNSDMNFYVSVFGGAAFADSFNNSLTYFPRKYKYTTKFDTGFIVGGAVGVDNFLIENLRSELEVSYFRFKPKSYKGTTNGFVGANPKGHLSSVNILANLWYDVDLGMAVTPYLGGGAGIGLVNSKINIINGSQWSGSDTGFAYQLGAGFKYDVSETLALDVGYRFRGVLGVKFNSKLGGSMNNGNVYAHTLQAGISFKLPPM